MTKAARKRSWLMRCGGSFFRSLLLYLQKDDSFNAMLAGGSVLCCEVHLLFLKMYNLGEGQYSNGYKDNPYKKE
jgi:hypothetical protein